MLRRRNGRDTRKSTLILALGSVNSYVIWFCFMLYSCVIALRERTIHSTVAINVSSSNAIFDLVLSKCYFSACTVEVTVMI